MSTRTEFCLHLYYAYSSAHYLVTTGFFRCGKGKGNKNTNCNIPILLPPVPIHPQYVLLPEDDPDCLPKMGKVKGTIFENTSSRPGIPGVNVVITDSSGKSLTVTTDVTGMYMVEVLAGCTITDIVQSSLPTGAVQTLGTNPMTLTVPAGGTATDSDGFQIPGPPGPMPGPTPAATP